LFFVFFISSFTAKYTTINTIYDEKLLSSGYTCLYFTCLLVWYHVVFYYW